MKRSNKTSVSLIRWVIDLGLEILSMAWLFRLLYFVGEGIAPTGVPRIHLRWRRSRCMCLHGVLPGWVLKGIEELLEQAGVKRGDIKLAKSGRTSFSRSIPADLHQRIRNFLASG